MDQGGTEEWRAATREQERRLWNTLCWVGAVLTLVLAGSIVVVRPDGSGGGAWFLVQQSVLLVLSGAGTALAFRRWRSLRAR
jgi:hypothetical protein